MLFLTLTSAALSFLTFPLLTCHLASFFAFFSAFSALLHLLTSAFYNFIWQLRFMSVSNFSLSSYLSIPSLSNLFLYFRYFDFVCSNSSHLFNYSLNRSPSLPSLLFITPTGSLRLTLIFHNFISCRFFSLSTTSSRHNSNSRIHRNSSFSSKICLFFLVKVKKDGWTFLIFILLLHIFSLYFDVMFDQI